MNRSDLGNGSSREGCANVISHITCIVMLTVAGESQDRRDDKLRWAACPCGLYRSTDDIKTLGQICAVD
jgi:hypothetical protein